MTNEWYKEQESTFHMNHSHMKIKSDQFSAIFTQNIQCQSLFLERKKKKNISNCHPLNFLPRVLSVKIDFFCDFLLNIGFIMKKKCPWWILFRWMTADFSLENGFSYFCRNLLWLDEDFWSYDFFWVISSGSTRPINSTYGDDNVGVYIPFNIL